MSKLIRLAAFLFCLGFAVPAWAQSTRTWVSGTGDDANPCSRTAPCKTWAGAISKTAASGEIDNLDEGDFGALTITKAITLDGGPGVAGIIAAGTNGITIAAGATDTVILRHLSFNGLGSGLTGISVTSAGTVHVEDCFIFGFTHDGISFVPTNSAALYVKNTVINANAQADVAVGVGTGATSVAAVIEKSSLTNSAIGLQASGTSVVTVHDSVFFSDSTYGIQAETGAQINMERGIVSNCGTGILGGGAVYISEVMVSDNTTGVSGTVNSFGNNRLAAGNTTTGAPASTIPQQ